MADWTSDIEDVLKVIQHNCEHLGSQHKLKYLELKELLKFFRIPIIVISGINSVISVGMSSYVEQELVSVVTCLLALICSVIGSVELFLSVQKNMEGELISHRDYYLLGLEIQKVLMLRPEHRPIPAKEFLQAKYAIYVKLIETSNVVGQEYEQLKSIPPIDDVVQ